MMQPSVRKATSKDLPPGPKASAEDNAGLRMVHVVFSWLRLRSPGRARD